MKDDHIVFRGEVVDLLDQRLLPLEEKRLLCDNVESLIRAIRSMAVRGAPAIGVAAAYGCVLAARQARDEAELERLLKDLENARPTAVNLSWAVQKMRALWQPGAPLADVAQKFLAQAIAIHEDDIAACRAIGRHGAELVEDGDCLLTHCNAGALATGGYGTALGVIRAAWEAGKKISVIADETRPLLQGARLTAWELEQLGIPVTIACDNACALVMGRGMVQKVVTGADRIAANGDTANKIGTCGVAIIARHFDIPFYIAAPLSTIDPSLENGSLIPIENRAPEEVCVINGKRVAPDGVKALNYAFDVTPARLVSGIITECGVLRPPYRESIARAMRGMAK